MGLIGFLLKFASFGVEFLLFIAVALRLGTILLLQFGERLWSLRDCRGPDLQFERWPSCADRGQRL